MADKPSCWKDARAWLRRLRRRADYQKETEKFEAWCKEVRSASVAEPTSLDDVREMSDDDVRMRFKEAAAKSGHSVSLRLPIHRQDLFSSVTSDLADVTVEGDNKAALTIHGSTFRNLELTSIGTVSLENCRIGRLGARAVKPNYKIKSCMIGEFDVHEGCPVQRMEWDGGYLGQFHLHGPLERAFVGDVWLHGLALPKNPENHGVQWLRDARAALNARSNLVAAGIFHASELALSREQEPCINRVASRVYQAFSNYGNSIGLPIAWLAGSLLVIGVFAFAVGTAPTYDPALGPPSGWHTSLIGEGLGARALRAAVYAMQSVFNPLNLIVPKPLVSVCCWWAALLSFVLGLLGIVAFALFLLSLRRRFKLE